MRRLATAHRALLTLFTHARRWASQPTRGRWLLGGAAIGLVLIMGACSLFGGGGLQIASTNFSEVVDLEQNLVFTFNKDLVDDERIGNWEAREYVRFEPAVDGRFQWTAKNELVFSPASGFAPATDYSAYLTEALLEYYAESDRPSVDDGEALRFHTPYLDIVSVTTYWGRERRSGKVQAQLTVNMNYEVRPDEFKNLASITLNDQPLEFTVRGNQPTASLRVDLAATDLKNKDELSIVLEVQPGLEVVASGYKTPEPLRYNATFPAQDMLAVSNVEATHDGQEGTIRVYTTQALASGNIGQHVALTPKANYRVTATENGFELRGSFDIDQTYNLKISKALQGILGTGLIQDFEQDVNFGPLDGLISFANPSGRYLSSKGERKVGLRIVNVGEVQVRVVKIYANNLQAFFREGLSYGYSYEDGEYNDYRYYNTTHFGDKILERTYQTQALPAEGGVRLLDLNFTDSRADYQGIYLVEVFSKEEYWVRANQLIAISDIGLIARATDKEVVVWANGLLDAQPRSGIELSLISTTNQTMLTGTTDSDGKVAFSDLNMEAPDFRTAMIVAKDGADFTYLRLQDSRIETSRFDVGGKTQGERQYDAYLYGDRELYRPGETIHVNALVRTFDWRAVKDMPVVLKVLMPNGREMTTPRGNLDAQGSFSTSIDLPEAAPTGTYTMELYAGNGTLIRSRNVSVEEFMPDRIKVAMELNEEQYGISESVQVSATATNLYGPPAGFRNYEVELSLRRGSFSAEDYPEYMFSLRHEVDYSTARRTGKTDGEGQLREVFDDFEDYQNTGLIDGRVFTTVFDETGRAVNRVRTFKLHTQPVYFGLKPFRRYVQPRQPIQIPLLAVDRNGKPVQNRQARLQIVKIHWETVVEKTYNGYRYRSRKREQIMVDKLVDVNGAETVESFTPLQYGQYSLRLYKPGANAYVEYNFYAYGWGGGTATFEVDPEGEILIETDKDAYSTGETARLLFKCPFDGRMLVTYERDRVLESRYLNVKDGSAELEVRLKDEHLPNIYVTATLFRPMNGAPLPLTVAHGFASLKVDAASRRLPVEISAVEKTPSREEQTITLSTKPGAYVTIAVVDEGILQIKNTQSPDAYDYFYAKRGLEVGPYDVYAALLPELRKGGFTRSSTGAGEGYDLARRVNPITNKRVKLVSFWSGVQQADRSGKVRYTINIPQFSGSLRIMAVAWQDEKFGASDANMTVADPVVISTALPRFLSPGDKALVPVTLANTTEASAQASAKITVEGPLRVEGNSTASTTIPAGAERRLQFELTAGNAIGAAKVSVSVQAGGKTYLEEIDIPVRPPSSLVKENGGGSLASGQSATLNLGGTGYLAQSRQAKLIVSTNPMVEFAKDLDYLLGYPHGCVEQTVSKAFPQLYYADLTKALGQGRFGDPAYNVQQAIAKLQSMQLYSGGMSFWPGGSRESWWGTAYATHFLLEAKEAGYEVSQTVLDRSLRYLQNKAGSRETRTYYLVNNEYRTFALKEIFYTFFVLAKAGQAPRSGMNFYKQNPQLLTQDSRYLLAGAYALAGDNQSFTYVLPNALGDNLTRPVTGGAFSSPIRDRAIALYALLEAEPEHAQVGALVQALSQNMKTRRWMSTQERVFGFLALGKFARQQNAADVRGTIKAGGRNVGKFEGETLVLSQEVVGQNVTVEASGNGRLFYFWEVSGIKADGQVTEEDSRMRVRKAFYDRNGARMNGTTFAQNELVVVRLTIAAFENERIENVVITDLLPAGFEIENPRITELPELDWIKDNSGYEHLDIRDDRIHFYMDVRGTREQVYYYVVRAVSPGTYKMGPVGADAMYQGEYHSYSGAGTVTVTPSAGANLGSR